jgi:hypothetical protein
MSSKESNLNEKSNEIHEKSTEKSLNTGSQIGKSGQQSEAMSSRPGYAYSTSSETSGEQVVHVNLTLSGQETRSVPVCATCHSQLNKLCSLDPNVTDAQLAQSQELSNKDKESKSSAVDKDSSSVKSSSPEPSAATSQTSSPTSSSGIKNGVSTDFGKSDKFGKKEEDDKKKKEEEEKRKKEEEKKKKKKEEEEEERKKRKEEEERKKRSPPQTSWQSSQKPSHEEYQKKKKKDY